MQKWEMVIMQVFVLPIHTFPVIWRWLCSSWACDCDIMHSIVCIVDGKRLAVKSLCARGKWSNRMNCLFLMFFGSNANIAVDSYAQVFAKILSLTGDGWVDFLSAKHFSFFGTSQSSLSWSLHERIIYVYMVFASSQTHGIEHDRVHKYIADDEFLVNNSTTIFGMPFFRFFVWATTSTTMGQHCLMSLSASAIFMYYNRLAGIRCVCVCASMSYVWHWSVHRMLFACAKWKWTRKWCVNARRWHGTTSSAFELCRDKINKCVRAPRISHCVRCVQLNATSGAPILGIFAIAAAAVVVMRQCGGVAAADENLYIFNAFGNAIWYFRSISISRGENEWNENYLN